MLTFISRSLIVCRSVFPFTTRVHHHTPLYPSARVFLRDLSLFQLELSYRSSYRSPPDLNLEFSFNLYLVQTKASWMREQGDELAI